VEFVPLPIVIVSCALSTFHFTPPTKVRSIIAKKINFLFISIFLNYYFVFNFSILFFKELIIPCNPEILEFPEYKEKKTGAKLRFF
jgi:hypothetical protein